MRLRMSRLISAWLRPCRHWWMRCARVHRQDSSRPRVRRSRDDGAHHQTPCSPARSSCGVDGGQYGLRARSRRAQTAGCRRPDAWRRHEAFGAARRRGARRRQGARGRCRGVRVAMAPRGAARARSGWQEARIRAARGPRLESVCVAFNHGQALRPMERSTRGSHPPLRRGTGRHVSSARMR